MALIPKEVTNLLSEDILLDDVRAFDESVIRLQPGITVNLLDLATDEDLAKSFHLRNLQDIGAITVVSTFDSADTQAVNLERAKTYSGTHSFQILSGDLTLTAAAGSASPTDPKFLAAMMGNLFDNGSPLTKASNYLGGLIGHYSVLGTKATSYPSGAILAGISDGVTDVDGAVVAYIDGDSAPSTRAGAAFKVRNNNSGASNKFDFGMDLMDASHDGYQAVSYAKGEIRLLGEAMIFTKAGAPVNGTDGANNAGPGSLLIDTSGKKLYINTNTKASPTWTVVGTQS